MNLNDILAKDPSNLTAEERAFLKEHEGELTDDQKTNFLPEDEKKAKQEEKEKEMDVEDVKKLVGTHIQEAMSKKVDEISEEIVAKFVAGAAESRKKALAGTETKPENEDKNKNTRAFMKALLFGDHRAAKAMSTTSSSDPEDAAAGLLIPPELMSEVLRIRPLGYGLARRDMRYLPFSGPGNSRVIPALGTAVKVFWTGEGAKKKSTQPKFSVITQTLKKLAAIVPMTEEIIEDSAVNLNTLIAELFAEAVGKEEDLQFFSGVGNPWTGIMNNPDVNKIASSVDDIAADDLLAMQDTMPSGALNGAKYYMHRTVLSKLRKLKDSQNRYIFEGPSGSSVQTLWNYPVETNDCFPTAAEVETGAGFVIFGNLKISCVFGDKQQLRVKLLTEASITDSDDTTAINLAEQDMIALRVVERVGYVCALPKAITILTSGTPSS